MAPLRCVLPALLSLLLLAGCAGQPAPSGAPSASPPATQSPAPTPSSAPQSSAEGPYRVEVHWDMLEQRKTPLAERWYPGYTADLIPSPDYGTLVPYVGGEKTVAWDWSTDDGSRYTTTEYLYGFATADGTIVTDAVYDSISVPRYYDAAGDYGSLPLWLVTQTAATAEGEAYTLAGLAAWDGSWYTGLKYRGPSSIYSPRSPLILCCEAGVLMRDGPDSAVMTGTDGTELYRWTADDFLSPDSVPLSSGYVYTADMEGVTIDQDSFFSFGIDFALQSHGPYFSFSLERIYTSEITEEPLWIDAYTGEFLDGKPDDVTVTPEQSEQDGGRITFPGGWYDQDDPATLHFDDGSTRPLPVDAGQWLAWAIRPPLAAFVSEEQVMLTDLDGAVLFQADTPPDGRQDIYFLNNSTGGPSLPCYSMWDWDNDTQANIIFGPDGQPIYTGGAAGYIHLNGETLYLVEEEWYLLLDLEGSELIRLPRLSAMDRPADE